MTQDTTDMPTIDSGLLARFSIDIPSQKLILELTGALRSGDSGRQNLTAAFSELVYVRTVSDLAMASENQVDVFEERAESALLNSIRTHNGWTDLDTDIGGVTIAAPHPNAPQLRHFFLQSTSLKAEWLCVEATFTVS
jgi:hypothetical protein